MLSIPGALLPFVSFPDHIAPNSVIVHSGASDHIFNHRKWFTDLAPDASASTHVLRGTARVKTLSPTGQTITVTFADAIFFPDAPACVVSTGCLGSKGASVNYARRVITTADGTDILSFSWQNNVPILVDLVHIPDELTPPSDVSRAVTGTTPLPARVILPYSYSEHLPSDAVTLSTATSHHVFNHRKWFVDTDGVTPTNYTARFKVVTPGGVEMTLTAENATFNPAAPSCVMSAGQLMCKRFTIDPTRGVVAAPDGTPILSVAWEEKVLTVVDISPVPTAVAEEPIQFPSQGVNEAPEQPDAEPASSKEIPDAGDIIPAEASLQAPSPGDLLEPLPTSGAVKADTAGSSTPPTHVPRPLPTSGAVKASSPHVPRPLPASGAAEVRTSGAVASPVSKTIAGGTADAADDVFDRFHTTLLSTMQRCLSYSQKMHSWDLVDPPPDSRRRLCRPIFTGGFGFSGRVSLAGF